uniref:Limiting CO2-inducible protein B/C beta carbonyic anhydrase domain-containing protein n=2 Tax=Amphora coffeiformis TaxID=265554 RepID=A0A7S3KYN0_9STRA
MGAVVGSAALRDKGSKAMLDRIDEAFPGSLTNKELVSRVSEKLAKYGYDGKTTLLCTSVCCDEITRPLESDFAAVYRESYRMGGLAGFPWGGITAFASMVAHIPDGGSALLVYAPHVGVDAAGYVGTVTRRHGDSSQSPCCDAAVGASRHVVSVWTKDEPPFDAPSTPHDAQHVYLCDALMPYAARLDESSEPMVELPYALYDAQKEIVTNIVQAGCGGTIMAAEGKVAVLGGIQINTPPGHTDYFLPLSFELFNPKGEKLEDLTL